MKASSVMTAFSRAIRLVKDSDSEPSIHYAPGLTALKKVGRCHARLSRLPTARENGRTLAVELEKALASYIRSPFRAEARLSGATVRLSQSLSASAVFALVELSQVGSWAVLEVELGWAVHMVELLTGATPRKAPVSTLTRVEEAAFSYWVLLALSAVRKHHFWHEALGARLVSVFTRRDEVLQHLELGRPHLSFEMLFSTDDTSGQARLLLPDAALDRALSTMGPAKSESPTPRLLSARLSFTPRLGGIFLTSSEIENLTAGDVVLHARARMEGQLTGAACLCGDSFSLSGSFEKDGFQVSEVETQSPRSEVPMSKTLSSSLPVEVEIELAKIRMPLSELSALEPGMVLPLHVSPNENVLLRVGDRVIALAELVDVEGQLGARIVEMVS